MKLSWLTNFEKVANENTIKLKKVYPFKILPKKHGPLRDFDKKVELFWIFNRLHLWRAYPESRWEINFI